MKPLEIQTPVNPETGLTDTQVKAAEKNQILENATKSYKSIFLQHIFTFFNILNLILAGLVFYTGSYRNMLFIGIVIANTCIGLFQEIRSKRVLDKLALIHQDKATVLRNGKEVQIPVDQIAKGDLLILQAGSQMPVDGVVIRGRAEVNESALTGESDDIVKKTGDSIYSGCYLTSGTCMVQVVEVGDQAFSSKLLKEAKREKRYPSQLRDSLDAIIRFCTIILVPTGILLFAKMFWVSHTGLNDAILSSVAAMVGMIPEGLVILTSIALAVSSVKLAKQDVLVQELYCIETLARVDVLCLDKTGTLTTGKMKVIDLLPQSALNKEEIRQQLANMLSALDDQNQTVTAIRQYIKDVKPNAKADAVFPFNSTIKCSGARFDHALYAFGAYSFLFEKEDPKVLKEIEEWANKGYRVLAVARSEKMNVLQKGDFELLALLVIEDEIREDASNILGYFEKQEVGIRIISGDMPQTVQALAKRAGIEGECVNMAEVQPQDLARVMETGTIFGRVTPEQKKEMVQALQKNGHVVAMTGDGVNDVLALKQADCSIAMGTGTQAARSVSSLVLLRDQFNALPSILLEGRRVINNIQRTASLFLVKTLFSFFLSILTVFWFSEYPFEPIQLTLVSFLGVGFPSFVLTLEPNFSRVKGNFLINVLSGAIPGALSVVAGVVLCKLVQPLIQADEVQFSTMCTWLAGCNALVVLYYVCNPLTRIRKILLAAMGILFLANVIFIPGLYHMVTMNLWQTIAVCVILASILLIQKRLRKIAWGRMLLKFPVLKKAVHA